jgi:hypothetical protein
LFFIEAKFLFIFSFIVSLSPELHFMENVKKEKILFGGGGNGVRWLHSKTTASSHPQQRQGRTLLIFSYSQKKKERKKKRVGAQLNT